MIAYLVLATAHRGRASWLLVFACGWCGRTHAHGGGPATGPPAAGHRLSHCHHPAAPSGYTLKIVATEGAISPPLRQNPGVAE